MNSFEMVVVFMRETVHAVIAPAPACGFPGSVADRLPARQRRAAMSHSGGVSPSAQREHRPSHVLETSTRSTHAPSTGSHSCAIMCAGSDGALLGRSSRQCAADDGGP